MQNKEWNRNQTNKDNKWQVYSWASKFSVWLLTRIGGRGAQVHKVLLIFKFLPMSIKVIEELLYNLILKTGVTECYFKIFKY